VASRLHYASKATGEVASLMNRLAAQGDHIEGVYDLGDQWVVISIRPARVEVRVEQPDTKGDASREVRL
jgi:hypothetical protein